MTKKFPTYDDEIDLIELCKTVWDEKIKIFIILFIALAIFTGYNYYKPKKPSMFEMKLVIKPQNIFELSKFVNGYIIIPKEKFSEISILNMFIAEILDYDEIVSILKDNENIKENISKLDEKAQIQKLYDYAKRLVAQKLDNEVTGYTLKFTWNDSKEGRDILEDTLKLALTNLNKSIFKELELSLEIKKVLIINEDKKEIEYLKEQSFIAKELNIVESQIRKGSFPLSTSFFNMLSHDTHYLRGYKLIDMEIKSIENRRHGFLEMDNQLNILKKIDLNWVNYNIFLIEIESLNKPKSYISSLILTIISSLIAGVFYVFMLSIFKPHKVIRQK